MSFYCFVEFHDPNCQKTVLQDISPNYFIIKLPLGFYHRNYLETLLASKIMLSKDLLHDYALITQNLALIG